MVGRKLSTFALAGSIAIVAFVGGCRDQATTAPGTIGNSAFAAGLLLLSGDAQTGAVAAPLPVSLTVKVVDAGGTPVSGAAVRWSVLSGGGSVTPPTGASDGNGLVMTSWTLGTSLGANKVRAFLTNGYVVDSVDFTANAISGTPVVITLGTFSAPPLTARVGQTLSPLVYTVADQFGHPVEGATVTFGTGFGSGSVTPLSGVTSADGSVSTTWTLGTVVGTQSASATLAGQLPLTSVLTATADTSRRLTILAGNNQTAAVNATLAVAMSVQVTDRFNNVIVGDVVQFNDSIGNGSVVSPISAITDATGVATATWQLGAIAGVQKIRIKTPGSGGQFARFTATAALSFRDVFVGNFFTCGVATNDRAYCWGFGDDGQLGLGPTPATPRRSRATPTWPVTQSDTLLGPYPTFRSVSGGKSHACGITIARNLMCWGANPDLRAFAIPAPGSQFASLAGATSVRTLGTGESFSCFTSLAGLAACAGSNEVGESSVSNPSPAGTGWSSITAGQRHGCGMPRYDPTSALTIVASQTPSCWGLNDNGQLGDGPASVFANFGGPVPMFLPVGVAGFDSTSLVAGAAHTCALTPAGAAYCWGSNSYGQLGSSLVQSGSGKRSPTAVLVDATVSGPWKKLYAGEYHTCGISVAGPAYCWGLGTSGQLGDGTVASKPFPVPVTGGLSFTSLAMGETHTCGIVGTVAGAAGQLLCWGGNEFGQLGIGVFSVPTSVFSTPQAVFYQQ